MTPGLPGVPGVASALDSPALCGDEGGAGSVSGRSGNGYWLLIVVCGAPHRSDRDEGNAGPPLCASDRNDTTHGVQSPAVAQVDRDARSIQGGTSPWSSLPWLCWWEYERPHATRTHARSVPRPLHRAVYGNNQGLSTVPVRLLERFQRQSYGGGRDGDTHRPPSRPRATNHVHAPPLPSVP